MKLRTRVLTIRLAKVKFYSVANQLAFDVLSNRRRSQFLSNLVHCGN